MSNLITPIYRDDTDTRSLCVNKNSIYGVSPEGRYVAYADDLLFSFTEDNKIVFERVVNVDDVTNIPTLVEANVEKNVVTNKDVEYAIDPYYSADVQSFHVYFDKTELMTKISIDPRRRFFDSETTYIRLYRGNPLSSSSARIISATYNGIDFDETVNVELESRENGNYKVAPNNLYSKVSLEHGETLFLAAYSVSGDLVAVYTMTAVESKGLIMSNATTKNIADIRIVTPWLNPHDDTLIDCPNNLTLDSINMMGRVYYTNGDVVELPVDGTKFKMFGLNQYIPSSTGQSVRAGLVYTLAADEGSVSTTLTTNDNKIIRPYRVRTIEANGAYGVKLFAYPRWVDAITGYRLVWFLYNIKRDRYYEVSNLIEMTANSETFNGKTYGISQTLQVAIDLSRVDPSLVAHRHIQTVTISLLREGSSATFPLWTVEFDPNQDVPYGVHGIARLSFVTGNTFSLDLKSGASSKVDWLDKIYFNSKPIFDPKANTEPPIPTHFTVEIGNSTHEYSVEQWGTARNVVSPPTNGDLIRLHFYQQVNGERLRLNTVCIPVRRI